MAEKWFSIIVVSVAAVMQRQSGMCGQRVQQFPMNYRIDKEMGIVSHTHTHSVCLDIRYNVMSIIIAPIRLYRL